MNEIITYILIAIVIFLIYKTIVNYSHKNSMAPSMESESSYEDNNMIASNGSLNSFTPGASESLTIEEMNNMPINRKKNIMANMSGKKKMMTNTSTNGKKHMMNNNHFVSKQKETFDGSIPEDQDDANYVSSQKSKFEALESKCPIFETDMLVGEFQRNVILDKSRHCGPKKIDPVECPDKFRSDFFGFRNNVMGQSHQNDMAMRVASFYLDGNKDIINKLEGRSMKDIFDDTMKETNLYTSKSCARIPNFEENEDNASTYASCGAQSPYITQSMWTYPNDKEMNGSLTNGSTVYDYDPALRENGVIDIAK